MTKIKSILENILKKNKKNDLNKEKSLTDIDDDSISTSESISTLKIENPKDGMLSFLKNKFNIKNDNLNNVKSDDDDFTRPTFDDDEITSISSQKVKNKLMNLNKASLPTESNTHSNSFGSSQSLNSISSIRNKKLFLIGDKSSKKQYFITLSIGALSLIGFIVGTAYFYITQNQLNDSKQLTTELYSDIQKTITYSTQVIQGKEDAFIELTKNKNEIKNKVDKLNSLNKSLGSAIRTTDDLGVIERKWKEIEKNVNDLLNTQNLGKINNDGSIDSNFLLISTKKMNEFSELNSELSILVDRFAAIQSQTGLQQSEANNTYFLRLALQRINSNITTLLLSGSTSSEMSVNLAKDRNDFTATLSEMRWGNPSKNIAPMTNSILLNTHRKISTLWVKFSEKLDLNIISKGSDIIHVKSDIETISLKSKELNQMLNNLNNSYSETTFAGKSIAYLIFLLSFIFFVISAISSIYVYIFEKDNSSLLDKIENNKNQGAILRLLDEISPLSEGDLTKRVTVTEEITGTIADSINLVIEDQLDIVKRIKASTDKMKNSAKLANEFSSIMLTSSNEQSKNIIQTGDAVLNMTKAINRISDKTSDTSKVALNSKVIAEEGEKYVQASVLSMNTIHENMSQTVRLMSRLDQSSKQISEIVGLLSDITEETSVLALNATVQAVKAGEAGKGFKVVADSVQRLADKAADATRKVGALINTTQTDINEVVISVSKTNEEVAKGTYLSEQAGLSLNEITKASSNLSTIIQNISNETKENALLASDISLNIKKILFLTKESELSNTKTASSIVDLAKISQELEDSVRKFKVDE